MVRAEGTFKLDDGTEVPYGSIYFDSFLSPTTKGTNARDTPPAGGLSERQIGRVLLQVHQIISFFSQLGIDLEGKVLHDIGTGNGLIPRLLLDLTSLASAVGSDPFLDGEHTTSWQPHDRDQALQNLRAVISNFPVKKFCYKWYEHMVPFEHHSVRPKSVPIPELTQKSYRFSQTSVHDLPMDGEEFDVFYCKAIEHIDDWASFFESVSKCSRSNAVIYLKHRSFFSYLGPHRYGTLDIPWGHLILSDAEYCRYVEERFPSRAKKMIDFYFNGLSFPRKTVPDMVRIAQSYGFLPKVIVTEPFRNIEQAQRYLNDLPGFWERVNRNFPSVGADEVFSGMHHIVLQHSG